MSKINGGSSAGLGGGEVLPGRLEHHIRNGLGGGLRVDVANSRSRPLDADLGRRPDSKQRAALWQGKPERLKQAWMRGMYDVNEKLIKDLSGCATIKVGGLTARTFRGDVLWQDKEGT
jgi:hypothetical protein